MAEYYNYKEGNQVVDKALKDDIAQYASALDIQLDDADFQEILNKIRPVTSRWTTETNLSSADIENAIVKSREFLLPVMSQRKLNPTASGDHIVQAGNAIRTVLGRDPTTEEAAYFAKELAQGKSAYELQQELMSLPEYQKIQAAKDRGVLGEELLNQQKLAFEKASPAIIAQFMKAGRLSSSGLDAALANAQKELEDKRQGFLGQVGYQDISNIRNNAYNEFQNYNRGFNDIYGTASRTQSQYNLLGNAIKRMNEQADYTRQQNDYMKYLQMAGKNNGVAGGLQGAMGGAQAGAAFGPWGALIGGVGGAAAGYFGTKK